MTWYKERVWRAPRAPDGSNIPCRDTWWNCNDDVSIWKSSSAARKGRRHFAEVIGKKLVKIEGVEKLAADLQTILISVDAVVSSIFGMLASQMQGHTSSSHPIIQGATYYVEVPTVQYVDKKKRGAAVSHSAVKLAI